MHNLDEIINIIEELINVNKNLKGMIIHQVKTKPPRWFPEDADDDRIVVEERYECKENCTGCRWEGYKDRIISDAVELLDKLKLENKCTTYKNFY